jgi:tripartite-type tricarboxylate transporter receptor subunit TctC
MEPNMRFAGLALVCGVLAASAVPAAAGEWPDRPLTMVYPFTPGSAGDGIGRILAPRLAELLGRPVLFENVGGAGGMTGALRVAKGEPDGTQFLLGGTFLVINQAIHRQAPFHAVNDFAPVALLAGQPTVLIGRKDLPANNLPELIAYTRANRGKTQYGSAGVGAVTHLSCMLLTSAIGSDAVHVPYRGGGGALQDLLAGRIDYQCPIVNVALPQIQAGTVKALAILSKQRSPALPELASAHEQGLADFDVTNWYAFFLPKDTPAAIVQKLHAASAAALETPSVQEKLKALGAAVTPPAQRTPAYLKEYVGREIAKWAPVIKAAGAQVD